MKKIIHYLFGLCFIAQSANADLYNTTIQLSGEQLSSTLGSSYSSTSRYTNDNIRLGENTTLTLDKDLVFKTGRFTDTQHCAALFAASGATVKFSGGAMSGDNIGPSRLIYDGNFGLYNCAIYGGDINSPIYFTLSDDWTNYILATLADGQHSICSITLVDGSASASAATFRLENTVYTYTSLTGNFSNNEYGSLQIHGGIVKDSTEIQAGEVGLYYNDTAKTVSVLAKAPLGEPIVPEPATAALSLLALAGLASRRRRN